MRVILPAGDLTGPSIHHPICLGSLLKLQTAYTVGVSKSYVEATGIDILLVSLLNATHAGYTLHA